MAAQDEEEERRQAQLRKVAHAFSLGSVFLRNIYRRTDYYAGQTTAEILDRRIRQIGTTKTEEGSPYTGFPDGSATALEELARFEAFVLDTIDNAAKTPAPDEAGE